MLNTTKGTIFLIVLSSICATTGVYALYASWRALDWPSTTGLIIEKKQDVKGITYGQKSSPLVTTINEGVYFYTVNENSFTGFSAINKEFSVGKEIIIYYNPTDPSQSTLYRSLNWLYFSFFIAISFILAIAAYLWHKNIKALTRRLSRDAEKRRAP